MTNVLQSLSNVVTALANGAMLARETVLANGAAGGPGGSYRSQAGRVVLNWRKEIKL